MVHGISVCEKCKKEFKWRTTSDRKNPRLCSSTCKFKWKTATEDEKFERIKKSFEKDVIKKEDCWDWKGRKDKDGYCKLSLGSNCKIERASIASWIIHKGVFEKGLLVLHKCDNRGCCNPEHLFLGTAKDNTQDMINKGRWNGGIWNQVGSENPSSKLKENEVVEIKNMILSGFKNREISKKFNVSIGTISDIRNNRYWKHIRI